MAEKVIMLGNEAIARGAYEAGVKVSSAYPGTPSTEISEYLVQYKDDVFEEFYELLNNEPMKEEQTEFVEKLIQDLKEVRV